MGEAVSFERIADRYDETRGGEPRGRAVARELDRLLQRGRPVLEIGVGTGLVAAGLGELGHRVVGIDLSAAMLVRARERIGSRVAVAEARRLPVASSTFDQAYSVWVLHVVGDKAAALREAARVLRPGGRFLVVPALGPPEDPVADVLVRLNEALDPAGERRDDPERLRALAPAAGLRVREVRRAAGRSFRESPVEVARRIEERVFSILWDVDERRWRAVVVPLVEELRAMGEEPIDRSGAFQIVVLERRNTGQPRSAVRRSTS